MTELNDRRHVLLRAFAAAAGCGFGMGPAHGADAARAIAVVFPDTGEPFRSAFLKIVDGIDERAGGRVARLPISGDVGAAALGEDLRRREVRVAILLGRTGLRLASALESQLSVVAGCVLSVPESQARGFPVHTLAPDPALLFDRLRALAPAVRRVWTVYDPQHNAWLMRLAREAARGHGLEFVAQEAGDLSGALHLYDGVMAGADPRRDALWLPQDASTVDDTTALPLLLKQAWDRGLALFSSNVAHVRRGALFSLFPDNLEVGHRLAALALQQLAAPRSAEGMQPLREVQAAMNTRTAGHLGLSLTPALVASYALVFPEP